MSLSCFSASEEMEELGCGGGSGVDHEARMDTSHHSSGHCWEELALICLQPGPALPEADAEWLPALLRALLQNQLVESDTKGLVGGEAGLEDVSGTAWKIPSC